MSGLQLVHDFEDEREVVDQVLRLQELESELKQDHSNFVAFSQLAGDLIAKLDGSNDVEANQIRQQIHSITQRWDNIVAKIDEHSHLLLKSGKAEALQLQHEDNGEQRPDVVGSKNSELKNCDQMCASHEAVASDPMVSSSSTISVGTIISPVDVFVTNVNRFLEELQPLFDWTYQFEETQTVEEVRNVIKMCQAKLQIMKEKEAKVNELHAELERIHNLDISISQLRLANDTFEDFTRIWSRIVTKISDTLNTLSVQGSLTGVESEEEIKRIAAQLDDFFVKAETVMLNCAQLPLSERKGRVSKLQEQLREQDRNIIFLEANHRDMKQMEDLKKRFVDLKESVDKLSGKYPVIDRLEQFLRATFPSAGDIPNLSNDLELCDELLAELDKYKTKDFEVEQLRKLGIAKRDSLADYLDRSRRNEAITVESENLLSALTARFAALKSAKLEVFELYNQFMELREDIQKGLAIQRESVNLNEEVMSIALSSSAPSRERIFYKLKKRMQMNAAGWSVLEDDVDESIALLEKECKRLQQG